MDDRISWNLTSAEQREVDGALATLQRILGPKTVSLTPQERQELPKMGDQSLAFVAKGLEYAGTHPEFLPPYVDVAALRADIQGAAALSPLEHSLGELAASAADTRLLAGSEAFTAVLSYYQSVKTAARRGIPGAEAIYRDLAERFPGTPRSNRNPPSS